MNVVWHVTLQGEGDFPIRLLALLNLSPATAAEAVKITEMKERRTIRFLSLRKPPAPMRLEAQGAGWPLLGEAVKGPIF